jgi:hypothetical protein
MEKYWRGWSFNFSWVAFYYTPRHPPRSRRRSGRAFASAPHNPRHLWSVSLPSMSYKSIETSIFAAWRSRLYRCILNERLLWRICTWIGVYRTFNPLNFARLHQLPRRSLACVCAGALILISIIIFIITIILFMSLFVLRTMNKRVKNTSKKIRENCNYCSNYCCNLCGRWTPLAGVNKRNASAIVRWQR